MDKVSFVCGPCSPRETRAGRAECVRVAHKAYSLLLTRLAVCKYTAVVALESSLQNAPAQAVEDIVLGWGHTEVKKWQKYGMIVGHIA